MSYPNTNLDTIETNQASKEVTANNLFEALSPAAIFGCDAANTSGLTFGYYGGKMYVDGVLTTISNSTVGLTNNTTNYVECTAAGVVSANTTGFTAGRIPLYTIVTSSGAITSVTPSRAHMWLGHEGEGYTSIAMTAANKTLSAAEARPKQLGFTGTGLGSTRNVVLPLTKRTWFVKNGTDQSLQYIGATGTGITVASGKSAIIGCDGTNIIRWSADV
jgi:hypothetical protein